MPIRLDIRQRFVPAAPAAPIEIDDVTVLRPLGPGRVSERWLARRNQDLRAFVAHLCPPGMDSDRWVDAASAVMGDRIEHALAPVAVGAAASGRPWALTEYTGDHEGLVSLETLVRQTGGRMTSNEARHAVEQLLGLLERTHAAGRRHGLLHLDELLVDRRGSVAVELFGMGYRLSSPAVQTLWSAHDEIRSVATVAAQLLTGATDDMIEHIGETGTEQVDASIGGGWIRWLDAALASDGFATASDARDALADALDRPRRDRLKVTTVRSAVERFLSTR